MIHPCSTRLHNQTPIRNRRCLDETEYLHQIVNSIEGDNQAAIKKKKKRIDPERKKDALPIYAKWVLKKKGLT